MIMTTRSIFFLPVRWISGKSLALRETQMAAFGRGTLAAALATAMAVVPAFAVAADDAGSMAAKPITPSATKQTGEYQNVLGQAREHSKKHPVVAIAIMKGQKETLLTGEELGESMSGALKDLYDVPSKPFVEQGGDYTVVFFAVKGLVYGPYGLKTSLGGMAMAADSYNEVLRPRAGRTTQGDTQTAFVAKPEPEQ